MSTERKILEREVTRLENYLARLEGGRSMFGEADTSALKTAVREELAAACERLKQMGDIPGQRSMFAA